MVCLDIFCFVALLLQAKMLDNGSNPFWKLISLHFKDTLPLFPDASIYIYFSFSTISEIPNAIENYKDKSLSACKGLI